LGVEQVRLSMNCGLANVKRPSPLIPLPIGWGEGRPATVHWYHDAVSESCFPTSAATLKIATASTNYGVGFLLASGAYDSDVVAPEGTDADTVTPAADMTSRSAAIVSNDGLKLPGR
jgi:hypothetical protein